MACIPDCHAGLRRPAPPRSRFNFVTRRRVPGECLVKFLPLAALASLLIATPAAFAAPPAPKAEAIRLATNPALSPDGSTLVFAWAGDLWAVPVVGGRARPLTRHPGRDREPSFSPDGKQVA